ncbi:MAG TPA: hypothetical protein VEN81_02115, partial [Planctomycetota bacterium]|nr:hypothetical protein [Planctomycetota bacterium]
QAILHFHDPEELGNLRTFLSQNPGPEREAFLAECEAVASGKWADLARKGILGGCSCDSLSHLHWALMMATERQAPWFEEVARSRLARITTPESGRKCVDLDPPHPWSASDEFDLILLALDRSGCALTEKESAYLRYYGYSCEPRHRLAEVLDEKKYPP